MPRPSSLLPRLLAACLALACAGAAALDATLALAQLHRMRWTTREEAPPDVNALAQTADGALWLAASTGLVRFDGVRFERFLARPGEAALTEDLSTLYAPPDGALWIGARLGGVHVLQDGHLTSYGRADGLPANTVLSIVRDEQGVAWVGTTAGLYRLDGARWRRVGSESGVDLRYVSSLLLDARGSLWATGLEGTFERPRGAADFERRRPGGSGAALLAAGPGGSAWLSDPVQGLLPLAGDAAPLRARDFGPDHHRITLARFDRDGGLWLVLDGALVRLPVAARLAGPARAQALREAERLRPAGDGAPAPVETALEDREGNLWLGTALGLERLRAVKLRSALPDTGPVADAALALAPDGTAWASDQTGARVQLTQPPRRLPAGAANAGAAAFAITTDGSQWIGGVDALERITASGSARVDTPLPGVVVQSLAPTRDGALWVSLVRGALWRRDGERWTLHGGIDGLPDGPALSLAIGADDALWAGYADGRVAVAGRAGVRVMGAAQGLRTGAVLALAPRGADEAWVGGTSGLALYRQGRFWNVAHPDGSAFPGVSGIVQTRAGELWFNGAAGITHVAADELARFVADPARHLASETFDHEDGLDGRAAQLRPVPTAVAAADGRLWFASSRELYWLDPAHLPRNAVPPTVRVLALQAGGRRYDPAPGLALPVRTSGLQIDYTAFSLTMPERVRFRYRLEGVDGAWQEAGPRRQAFYTNVPPGHYRFRVAAVNEDGVGSAEDATFAFEIPPSFWQTWWFRGLCALAALALLACLWTLRMRQLAARLASQHGARLQERERIARELHDTLLQSTQGLILNFQGIALQLPAADPMRERMEKTLDRADLILADARGRVLDLRSGELAAQPLPETIAEAARELAGDDAPAFSLIVEGTPRPLVPAVQVECAHIAREALANALAHAQARAIEVQVVYGPLSLRVRVRDDGRGIEPDVLAAGARPGHWGLVGMRERAERFGAHVELWSRAGAGTEVELGVPAAVAYARSVRRRWWQRRGIRQDRADEPPP